MQKNNNGDTRIGSILLFAGAAIFSLVLFAFSILTLPARGEIIPRGGWVDLAAPYGSPGHPGPVCRGDNARNNRSECPDGIR